MKFLSFCILSVSFVLIGCTTYYGNGNLATMTSFVPKPAFESDSAKMHHFISGSYNRSVGNSVYNKEDQNTFGELSYTIVNSQKRNKFAYTFFGYYGEFGVNAFEKESSLNGKYSYGGVGATLDFVNVSPIKLKNIELRPIGLRGTFLREFGEFSNFRNSNDSLMNLNPMGMSVTIGATSEIVIRSKKNQYGFFHTFGYTPLLNFHYGLSLYTRFNDLFYLSLKYNTHSYGYGMLGLGCSFVVK